jgi:hypothetical protein
MKPEYIEFIFNSILLVEMIVVVLGFVVFILLIRAIYAVFGNPPNR